MSTRRIGNPPDLPGAKSGNADFLVGAYQAAGEDAGAFRDWYSRGYLPHRDSPHLLQSITYRLSDSLPRGKLDQLEEELCDLPDAARRARIET